MPTRTLKLCLALVACVVSLPPEPSRAADDLSFNRDIRPILADNCFFCHGPDPNTREADLRIDTREGAVEDRGDSTAIVPGEAARSALIERITSEDPDMRMPPADSERSLTPEQIELLRRWVDQGAEYEQHWSFEPVIRRQPTVGRDGDPRENAVDLFVSEKLRPHGLSLSPPADRYTLIRRVYLDLLGLLPTLAEVDSFVADPRPDAYERLLDRIFASPRFGERWGRHWLDQARYADSHGYTNDNARIMWPYRDWVIEALNRDLSFDRFTIEQLAGDLLPEPTVDQLVATGFHRNTLINTEGGTKADQFRDEQVKDRVDTTGSVWLSLTVGCAQCHTHKFDPITQEEYYQFYAFFNSTQDSNSIVPTIKAPTFQQRQQRDDLRSRRDQLQQQIDDDPSRDQRRRAWEKSLLARVDVADPAQSDPDAGWTVLELDGKSNSQAQFLPLPDHSLLVSGANTPSEEYQITVRSPLPTIRSIRLEVLTHDSLPQGGPGRAANGNFVLNEFWFRTGDGQLLNFNKASADHSQPNYEVTDAIDGKPDTGWAINGSPEGGPNHNRTAWFLLPQPLEVEIGHALTFKMQFEHNSPYNIGRFRISASPDRYQPSASLEVLTRLVQLPEEERSASQREKLMEAFLSQDEMLSPHVEELQAIERALEELTGAIPTAMILRDLAEPRESHVQIRGDFLRPEATVQPNVPAVLPPLRDSTSEPQGIATRLDLARWLVRSDHPLTPRVRVNRLWMRMFGTSLVETENDFGTQGTVPTHPELLDWLADELVRQRWSTKRMLRLIASSDVYRQSSARRAELTEVDPNNKLLGRQNRIRVEGELVRDLTLAASGLLSHKIGGPSVHPPQPEGVYDFTQRKKDWTVSDGEDRYRRGMYTFFYRSAPYPMLTTFDAPKFNQTCTRRSRSNTPLQALTVANDAAIFEMTQALAARITELPQADVADRAGYLFRLCMARPPLPNEQQSLVEFWHQQRDHFAGQSPERLASVIPAGLADFAQADAAAWVATARVLVNLDEFITRE